MPSETTLSMKRMDISKLTIIKRDGKIMPFVKERIYLAIMAAFKAVEKTLPENLQSSVYDLTDSVVSKITSSISDDRSISVEEIQDLVELTLVECGFIKISKAYMSYREKRRIIRESKDKLVKVYRKAGKTLLSFNPIKVANTIEKVFKRVSKENHSEDVNHLTESIVNEAKKLSPIDLSTLEDMIEIAFMRGGFFKEAKDYILQRNKKHQDEISLMDESLLYSHDNKKSFPLLCDDGSTINISEEDLMRKIKFACKGFSGASPKEILKLVVSNFYTGVKERDLSNILMFSSRAMHEIDPCYTYITTRLLLDSLYQDVLQVSFMDPHLKNTHRSYFTKFIRKGVSLERLSAELLKFDLDALSKKIDLSRDGIFKSVGLQTLIDRYLIRNEDKIIETPQIFWMRVAMGLALKEKNYNLYAAKFYHVLSKMEYCPSTPTLFNTGTCVPQLSSCYISTTGDDLKGIFKTISDDAQLSKWSGGLGNDWTNVRALGSRIKGTNGKSQGVIPFLKVANDTCLAVNQGGKRKGSLCSYLETWHLDIEEFLELRKNTGDDRRRTHDMNTANWIPDLFFKRILENAHWTLFSPNETPDLHDIYGSAFEQRYEEYEKMAEKGLLSLYKRVDANDLWKKMIGMLFETGHPWITFKDPSNIRSTQSHVGVVHSSNLCTEILLNTSSKEIAVCNLGSINLVKHIVDKKISYKKLADTISIAIRMLDNVIDINFYPIKEAANSNTLHRPVGLGILGFQDILHEMSISYSSHEAVELSDEIMEAISYNAILTSSLLAKERGKYSTYKGSKWDQGLLPIDSIDLLEKERGEPIDVDRSSKLNWTPVRESIKAHGMRNSNLLAIAPTATISLICGAFPSIEPAYKHLYTKSNLSGEFTIINTYLVDHLKSLNIFDAEMIEDLKYYDGDISMIERIPKEIKELFPTCFDVDPHWLIECAARRQKWIDMGQSLNLYTSHTSGKKLSKMYIQAWKKGLKTTYYLRSLGKTQIEKSSMDINKKSIQPRWMKNKSSSSDLVIERCSLEEGCESCQ